MLDDARHSKFCVFETRGHIAQIYAFNDDIEISVISFLNFLYGILVLMIKNLFFAESYFVVHRFPTFFVSM